MLPRRRREGWRLRARRAHRVEGPRPPHVHADARGGPSWRRGYNRRGALERINSRLDNSFGFENYFIRGKAKIKARMGLALCVMMALALGAVMAGRPERMRSLVDPGAAARA